MFSPRLILEYGYYSNPIDVICYHGSHNGLRLEDFEDVIWFSNKPIYEHFGRIMERCQVRINNPLIIDAQTEGWDHKLWWQMFDEDYNQIRKPDDETLLRSAPEEIWKYIEQEGMDDEAEWGDIPYLVKNGSIPGLETCDGVFIKNIGETCNCRIVCDDYIIFDPSQYKVIDRIR